MRRLQARALAPGWWDANSEDERLGRAGDALVVSVHRDQTSLWLYRDRPSRGAALPQKPVGPVALAAHGHARVALSHSLKLLWTRTHTMARRVIRLTRLGTHLRSGTVDAGRGPEGTSVGLAFLLALASRATGLRLPADLVATAEITETGELRPVGGLEGKLAGLAAIAPGVRRVLVAHGQSTGPVPEGLEIVRVRTGREALALVFPDPELDRALALAGKSPAARSRVLLGLTYACMESRREFNRWMPVREATVRAFALWPLEDQDDLNRLRLIAAVTSRFCKLPSPQPLPDGGWVVRQPPESRAQILAQFVQQVTDTGWPSLEALDDLLGHVATADWNARTGPFLRLRGARARLGATRSRALAREALGEQEAVARGFLDGIGAAQTTFGLSEWFRLSGLFADEQALERALDFEALVDDQGGLAGLGGAYVALNRARARIDMGVDLDLAVQTLAGLVEERPEWTDIAGAARRALARALGSLGRSAEAEGVRQAIADPRQRALVAVDQGADRSVLEAVADMPLTRLLASDLDAARFYPY